MATTELEEFKGSGPLAIFLKSITPTATGWGAHMPLPHIARWFVVALLGEANEAAWRIPAAVMACVGAGVAFQVFAVRGRVGHGVVVGLLLALHPTVVFHAHSATGYAFGGASGALLFAGVVAFREGRGAAVPLLGSGMILGLGSTLFFVFPAAVAVVICAVSVARAPDRPERKRLAFRVALPTAVVLGPPTAWMAWKASRLTLLQVIEPHADEVHQGTTASLGLAVDLLRRYSASWFAGYAESLGDDPWVWAPGASLLVIGLVVSLASGRRDTPSSTAALLLGGSLFLIAAGHLGFVAVTGREFSTQPRIYTPLAVPLVVCWAAAVHPRAARWRGLTAGLLLLLLGTVTLRVHATWSDRDRWAAEVLDRLADEGDALLVTPQVAHRLTDRRLAQVPDGGCLPVDRRPSRIWWAVRGDHAEPPPVPVCDGSEISLVQEGYRVRFQASREPPLFERMSDSFVPTLALFLFERGDAARGPSDRPTLRLTTGLLSGARGSRLQGFVRSIVAGEEGGSGESFEVPFGDVVTLPVDPLRGLVVDLALHPAPMDHARAEELGGLRQPHAEALIGWRPLVLVDDPLEPGWTLSVPALRSPSLRVGERLGRVALILLLLGFGGVGWILQRFGNRSPGAPPGPAILALLLPLIPLGGCSCEAREEDREPEIEDPGPDPFTEPAIHGGNGLAWINKLGPSPRDFPGIAGVLGSPAALTVAGLGEGGRGVVSLDPVVEGRCDRTLALEASGALLASRFTLSSELVGGACSGIPRDVWEDSWANALAPLDGPIGDGVRLVLVEEPLDAGDEPPTPSCRLRGLQQLFSAIRGIGKQDQRNVALASAPPNVADGPSAWLVAEPSELISLDPLAAHPARLAITGQALRSQARRGLLRVGTAEADTLALHLVTGGVLHLDDGSPLTPEQQALVDYARGHVETMFLPRPRVAIYVPMASLEEGAFAARSKVPLEGVAAELTALGVPFDVVLGPDDRRLISTTTGESFDRFQAVIVLAPAGLIASQAAELARFRHGGLVVVLGDAEAIETAVASPGAEDFRWRAGRPERAGVLRLGDTDSLGEAGTEALAPFAMLPPDSAPTGGAVRLFRFEAPHEGLVALHVVRLGSLDGPVSLSVPNSDLPVDRGRLDRLAPGLPPVPITPQGQSGKRSLFELPAGHRWMTLVARPGAEPADAGLPWAGDGTVAELVGSSITLALPGWPAAELPALSLPEQWTVQRADSPIFDDLEGVWEVGSDRRSARRTARNDQVETVVSVRFDGGAAHLEVSVRNLGDGLLRDVRAKICLDPAGEGGFPKSGHDRTWIVDEAGRHPLSHNRHRFGDPLYVEVESFVEPLTVEESIGATRSLALAFERSGGVGGNALGGGVCIHAEPIFGDVAAGESVTVRGWLALVKGPANVAFDLYERSAGLSGSGRSGDWARGPDQGTPWTAPPACAARGR
jgi:hypothetical protein